MGTARVDTAELIVTGDQAAAASAGSTNAAVAWRYAHATPPGGIPAVFPDDRDVSAHEIESNSDLGRYDNDTDAASNGGFHYTHDGGAG
jgi:hypothetical protein